VDKLPFSLVCPRKWGVLVDKLAVLPGGMCHFVSFPEKEQRLEILRAKGELNYGRK
jgi:hypothetical protein